MFCLSYLSSAAAGKRVNHNVKRLRVEIQQIIKPADIRVPEVLGAFGLCLLPPYVVDWRVEVYCVIHSSKFTGLVF